MKINDFPKIESPFERGDVNRMWVCLPKFKREFSWILDKDKVIATEKFDGTNVSVIVEDGNVKSVYNRTSRIDIWKSGKWFYEGVKRSIDEKKFNPDLLDDGQYFGELIGPKLNGNPYKITEHLWIPFNYCLEHYFYKFYYKWLDENNLDENSKDEDIYNAFSELFKVLKSLWFRQRKKEKQPEGIVFHNKENGTMTKLRVDMWDWYKEARHKEGEK